MLDPEKSQDADYISRKIKERIKKSSAAIVLIGKETSQNEWVEKKIQWSKEPRRGIIGIRINPDTPVPDGLTEFGAEILDWNTPADVNQLD